MEYLIQVLVVIGVIMIVIFPIIGIILYSKIKTNLKNKLKTLTEKYNLLEEKYKFAIEELMPSRKGWYNFSVLLQDDKDKGDNSKGDIYDVIIYVKEIDRYTSGLSKIQITDIEIVTGFDNKQFEWVKTCIRKKFASIKKTADIQWLESELSIKEARKQKLNKINSTK